jgi:hypothetical protein
MLSKRNIRALTLSLLALGAATGFLFTGANGQTIGRRGVVSIGESGRPVVDISKRVFAECSESLRSEVDGGTIELRFQPSNHKEAVAVFEGLERSFALTNKLTSPIRTENLRFYLYRTQDAPVNYKIIEAESSINTYVDSYVAAANEHAAGVPCGDDALCDSIFHRIPHELAHTALNDLISRRETRWFDEGFAEYVANGVMGTVSPQRLKTRLRIYLPEVSLHRRDIRRRIFDWKEVASVGEIRNSSSRDLQDQGYMYGAAFQLIADTLSDAEARGKTRPIPLLLTRLKELRDSNGRPAAGEDIKNLIKGVLGIDVRKIGQIDPLKVQTLADDAFATLSHAGIDQKERQASLYTIAALDEAPLDNEWVTFLLNVVYGDPAHHSLSRSLAATALVARMSNIGFEEKLRLSSSKIPLLRKRKLKTVRAELNDLSLWLPGRIR